MTGLEGFDQLERLAADLLAQVSPAKRRSVLMRVARHVQASQRNRIGRQEQPDGSKFAPRHEKRELVPGAYPLKFLYPKGAAEPRLVHMRSWTRQGPIITGFDIEAEAIRSFYWDKVDRFLPVPAGEAAQKPPRRRRQRRAAMFRRLRLQRLLRAGAGSEEAWAGFDGRAAAIALVHHEGGRDRPAKGAKTVRYDRRILLGLSTADQATVLHIVQAAIFV